MLHLLYFAAIKERMGLSEERVVRPPHVATVGALVDFLQARDEAGRAAFANPSIIRAAVNLDFADPDTKLDEVAFFPPVTGG